MIAALFVETGGCYFNLPDVNPWDKARDARTYPGPYPVVAHPPCERWGRFWHGSPRRPHHYQLGHNDGCFAAALNAVRRWGGVLEHPAYSHAWQTHGLQSPMVDAITCWWPADKLGGLCCHVEQAHYGHMARKATWLYVCGVQPPELISGPAEQPLPQIALKRYRYEKARRSGVMACIGGKKKSPIRAATPAEFRNLLISIAASATPL